jgi:diguanylate cyclase (GGDEF)-like protein/PAS domain S-box-containing protein
MNLSQIKAVLWIEDNPGDARLIREMFNEPGYPMVELIHVDRMSEAERHLSEHSIDLVLLDLGLPDAQGMDAVRRAHKAAQHAPLIVLSGLDDEVMALQALQEGAQDYLLKGQIEARGLLRSLRYSIERKQIEENLFAEKERAQATLRCIGDAVVSTDIDGNIAFLNPVAERMMLWPMGEAVGKPLAEVLRIVDASTHEGIQDPMQRALLRNQIGYLPLNCVLVRRDGFEIPVEDSASPIHDINGLPTGAVIVLRDVSSGRAMAQLMAHAATHDNLSGLPNRILLNERIGHAIALARRHNHKVAVLYLDLDGFKHINDSLGHQIGDQVLQSVASRLLSCVRTPDTVSRQGGDEFLILLSEVDHPDGSANVAQRLLNSIAGAHFIGERDLHITASIGVSVYPDDGPDAEALIRSADTAMYQAKENGRHGFQFFTPEMNVRAVERQSIEEGLRHALDHGELQLHYQPKINLKTGRFRELRLCSVGITPRAVRSLPHSSFPLQRIAA